MKKGVYEVMDVVFRDYVSKKPVFLFDTLKISTVNVTGEQNEATGGKGNAALYIADHSRKATIDITDALISMTSLAMLAGKNGPSKGSRIVTAKENFNVTIPEDAGTQPTGGKLKLDSTLGTVTKPRKAGQFDLVIDGTVRIPINVDQSTTDKSTLVSMIVNEINNYSSQPHEPRITATAGTGGEIDLAIKMQVPKATVTVKAEDSEDNTGIVTSTVDFSGGIPPVIPTMEINLKYTPIKGSVYMIERATEDIVAINDGQITGKKVTVQNPNSTKGTIIYQYLAKQTKYVVISAEAFPGYFEVEGSTIEVDACSGVMKELIVLMRKAKLGSNFTIELNSEATPAQFAFNVTAMRDCDSTDLIEFIEVDEAE